MDDRSLEAWIAEHVMGWERIYGGDAYRHESDGRMIEDFSWQGFTTDLNACALAEVEIAGKVDVGEYVHALREVVAGVLPEDEMVPDSTFTYHLLTATARHRCEAMHAIGDQIEKERAA